MFNFDEWANQYSMTDVQKANIQKLINSDAYIQNTRHYTMMYGQGADNVRVLEAAKQLGILTQTQSGGQFGDWTMTNTGASGAGTPVPPAPRTALPPAPSPPTPSRFDLKALAPVAAVVAVILFMVWLLV